MSLHRCFVVLLLVWQPFAAWADGKIFPPAAFPDNVIIPDQRALIHFAAGTERLVIETRFNGSGTNFAWIVPLPAAPVVEAATTGLFPTLQYLFQPQIRHSVPRYYLTHCVLILIVILVHGSRHPILVVLGIMLIALFLALLLLPTLRGADTQGISLTSTEPTVSILDRKLVGVYETTTIASQDPQALQTWLRQNGFVVPANSEPVIADYVKAGWVFVAAKVRRDQPARNTSTPYPLSFTFPTARPVYPLKLTGVGNDSLRVELYVFGPGRAQAPHFKVERCARPNYPTPAPKDFKFWSWRGVGSETLDVVHPLLRLWVGGTPVATKLTATLSPQELRQDVWLEWTAFSEKRRLLFSRTGAWILALNWGTGIFLTGLLVIYLRAFAGKVRTSPSRLVALLLLYSLLLTGVIYLALPKTQVRVVNVHKSRMSNLFYYFYQELAGELTPPLSVADVRDTARNIISVPDTNSPYWNDWSQAVGWKDWRNHLLGGPLREEDSPGNYQIRETDGQVELVVYDGQGAEHVEVLGPGE